MGAQRVVSTSLVRIGTVVVGGRGDTVARSRRLAPIALALCAVVLLALFAGVAQAEPPALISYGNFNSQTGWGIGAAVDQSSGDVYVSGLRDPETGAPPPVNKFDASGKLLSPPSPFGAMFHAGAAVNPVNGDVYVLNAIFSTIEVFDPASGAQLSSFSITPSKNFGPFTIVQIATDAAGNVYLPVVPANEVLEYSPAGTLLHTITGSGAGALSKPTGVAVDSSGNLWVADGGNNRVEELSPAGAPVAEIKSEGVQSVVLNAQGHVLAIVHNSADFCGSLTPPCFHLVEYSAAGAQLADIGAGTFGSEGLTLPVMLAVNQSNGRVYVNDGIKEVVWVYGPPTAPGVDNELAAEVSTSEAKLGALVNPGGLETSYRFEYGATSAYGDSTPFPEGNVGQGIVSRTVWAAASGLAPGTTYHYRVVATNELGTSVGADQTFTTEAAAEAGCPNEPMRNGFSASLPDCRAYELVTPPSNTDAQPDTETTVGRAFGAAGGGLPENAAAPMGERMSFLSTEIMPGAQTGGLNYVATRGTGGWSYEDVVPPQSDAGDRCPGEVLGNKVGAYSADLTQAVLRVGAGQRAGETPYSGGCGNEGLEIVSGEPLGVENLLLRDNLTGAYRLINVPPAGVTPTAAHLRGASVDLGHVIFSENARLTTNAAAGVEELYEWDDGALRLVTVLPDGSPAVGSFAGISTEGTRVFFTVGGDLYVRVNGEETVQLDKTQGGAGPGGGGSLQGTSVDGAQVFLTDGDSSGLTGDTVSGSGSNLYLFTNGRLTDLTPAQHAEVTSVMGISKDGASVYFAANGALTGSQANQRGETAQAGRPNVYLWHDGLTTFISQATLGDLNGGGARVSSNGAYLTFVSSLSLTGYDNTDAGGQPDPEIYLYSAASNQLACVSCDPSGQPPAAGGATMTNEARITTRYLSNNGRVFFQTWEALLPRDTNGQLDVYEYEQGQLHLISTGTSASRSVLLDAGESGDDVFFLTRQSLLPQDNSAEALVIYDARVDGGFPDLASPPACTTADACRTPVAPQPSIYGAPSSQTFSGVGNLAAPVFTSVKTRSLTRAQKLAQALKACRKKRNRTKRLACERQARKRYGAKASRSRAEGVGKANASKRGK